LERAKRSNDGTANPCVNLSFWCRNNHDSRAPGRKAFNLVPDPLREAGHHSGSSCQNYVFVEITTHVPISQHHGLEQHGVDPVWRKFFRRAGLWIEELFCCLEGLVSNTDDPPIREGVRCVSYIIVQLTQDSDLTDFLFYIADDF
jgi:hypothetical protein